MLRYFGLPVYLLPMMSAAPDAVDDGDAVALALREAMAPACDSNGAEDTNGSGSHAAVQPQAPDDADFVVLEPPLPASVRLARAQAVAAVDAAIADPTGAAADKLAAAWPRPLAAQLAALDRALFWRHSPLARLALRRIRRALAPARYAAVLVARPAAARLAVLDALAERGEGRRGGGGPLAMAREVASAAGLRREAARLAATQALVCLWQDGAQAAEVRLG